MLNKISSMLDAVADSLEKKGFIKEAFEIDKIADELDIPVLRSANNDAETVVKKIFKDLKDKGKIFGEKGEKVNDKNFNKALTVEIANRAIKELSTAGIPDEVYTDLVRMIKLIKDRNAEWPGSVFKILQLIGFDFLEKAIAEPMLLALYKSTGYQA